jgi:c-di-AMP phosphodiesterase-like protein
MKLEKAQNMMGGVIASLFPLGILSYFFPALTKIFYVVFAIVIIYALWEKEQQLKRSKEEVTKLKERLEKFQEKS